MIPASLALGQAGVYRVAAELLLRRVPCSLPIVDTGVDVLLAHGVRIQVKASRLRSVRNKSIEAPSLGPAYRFTLSMRHVRPHYVAGRPRTFTERGYVSRRYSDTVDYLVFWGIDEDRFWVVPASLCDERRTLVIYPRGSRASRMPMKSFSVEVDGYEGRWESLLPVLEPPITLHAIGEN